MYNKAFSEIDDTDIIGEWKVEGRYATNHDASGPLTFASQMDFTATKHLQLLPHAVGSWMLDLEETMGRPYIHVTLNELSLKGLITRFTIDKLSNDIKLYLYFNTGLELTLLKIQPVLAVNAL